MSMFPVQNYGKDFTDSFVGMGNFINGMDQRKFENERQLKADDRADKALKLQQDSTASTIAHNNAQTAKIGREEADAKELQKWIRIQGEIDPTQPARPLSKEALESTAKLGARMEYFPNDLREKPIFDKAVTTLGSAFNQLKAAAPSDKAFMAQRGDAPQINDAADAHDYLYGDVQKNSHVNDGIIKELPKGANYSINRTEGFTFTSGPGTGAYTPWYSIVDGNGNVVTKEDGSPVMVPRTAGRSNSPDAKIEAIPIEAAEMKLALGKSVSDAISRLSPEEAKYVQNRIHAERLTLGDKTAIRDDKPTVLADGATLVRNDGTVIAENAKTQMKGDRFKTEEGVPGKPGFVQDIYYDGDGKLIKKGEPRMQFNPKGDGGGASKEKVASEKESKADIDKSLSAYYKKTADYDKRLRQAKTLGDTSSYPDLEAERSVLAQESKAITDKMAQHEINYKRRYTPTAVPAKGMETKPAAKQQAQQQPQQQKTASVTPPAGFNPTGKTIGGKPAFVSADGKKIWTP